MRQKGFAHLLLIILVGVLLLGGVYYLGTQNNSSIAPSPTPTPSAEHTDWKTYTNTDHGFSIQYPTTIPLYRSDWEYKEFPPENGNAYWVGFRPTSMQEDYLWGVWIYDNKTIDELVSEMGAQFKDRVINKENITINGNSGVLVTATTGQYDDWILKVIYIEYSGKIFAIGNGAMSIPEFDDFYKSFKFTS